MDKNAEKQMGNLDVWYAEQLLKPVNDRDCPACLGKKPRTCNYCRGTSWPKLGKYGDAYWCLIFVAEHKCPK
jgi:hypothetical protein